MENFGDDIIGTSKSLASSKVWKTAGGIGTVISVGLDYDEQMSKYNDAGRAVKKYCGTLCIKFIRCVPSRPH